jgi:hypothetical protein
MWILVIETAYRYAKAFGVSLIPTPETVSLGKKSFALTRESRTPTGRACGLMWVTNSFPVQLKNQFE